MSAPERPELRPVVGWPRYAVAADGSVWSRRGDGWRRLRPCLIGGRWRVELSRDGVRKIAYVARLWRDVWGPDAMVPGRKPSGRSVGSAHGRARLTEPAVIEARRLRSEGWTERALAERWDVSPATMHYALVGKSWSHVPMEGATK